jgi:hypothetical protein
MSASLCKVTIWPGATRGGIRRGGDVSEPPQGATFRKRSLILRKRRPKRLESERYELA